MHENKENKQKIKQGVKKKKKKTHTAKMDSNSAVVVVSKYSTSISAFIPITGILASIGSWK
jgi:hypothetical protein